MPTATPLETSAFESARETPSEEAQEPVSISKDSQLTPAAAKEGAREVGKDVEAQPTEEMLAKETETEQATRERSQAEESSWEPPSRKGSKKKKKNKKATMDWTEDAAVETPSTEDVGPADQVFEKIAEQTKTDELLTPVAETSSDAVRSRGGVEESSFQNDQRISEVKEETTDERATTAKGKSAKDKKKKKARDQTAAEESTEKDMDKLGLAKQSSVENLRETSAEEVQRKESKTTATATDAAKEIGTGVAATAAELALASKVTEANVPAQHQEHVTVERAAEPRRLSGSKIVDLFPGMERVKRRASTSDTAFEPQEKRLHLPEAGPSTSPQHIAPSVNIQDRSGEPSKARKAGISPPQDPASLSASAAHELLEQELRRSSSHQSIREIQEPTWDFPENRDSAVQLSDSPRLSRLPIEAERVRDSGYHDVATTPPMSSSERETRNTPKDLEKQTLNQRTVTPVKDQSSNPEKFEGVDHKQPSDPIRVSVEVAPDWELSIKKNRRSEELPDLVEVSPIERTITPPTATSRDIEESPQLPSGSPEPTRETPRRMTASAASTPASQKRPLPSVEEPPSESRPRDSDEYLFGDVHSMDLDRSLHGTSPIRHMRSPSVPLDTIREYSPDESPLSKKSRDIRDVGAPERGVKSRRRTLLQEQEPKESGPLAEQFKSPPRTPIGNKTSTTKASKQSDSRLSDEVIDRMPWPEVDEDQETISLGRNVTLSPTKAEHGHSRSVSMGADPVKQSPRIPSPMSAVSDRSGASINRFKTPDHLRPQSSASNRSSTPPLRRIDHRQSGDLRAAAKSSESGGKAKAVSRGKIAKQQTRDFDDSPATPGPSTTHEPPKRDKGKGRAVDMDNVYEGWGDVQASPLSPTRPPSVRKRQSMQILDLEAQIRMMEAENQKLQQARQHAEETAHHVTQQRSVDEQMVTEQVEARDRDIRAKDAEIAQLTQTVRALQEEVNRLTEINDELSKANKNLSADTNQRYATLQSENAHAKKEWQTSILALEALRSQHSQLTSNMDRAVRDEINTALTDRDAEITRLNAELQTALATIEKTKAQILASKEGNSFLTIRDEDYFDSACQQLCQHVQSWVLRFSKYSDKRACRLTSDLNDDKIEGRLDNAILDGSDVDVLLADRQKRRDVFMSVVMTMVWEFVFTRYLFGMDREQRQKLKALEKQLSDIGPQRAVAHWRAITLTLLCKRDSFAQQRGQDTEAVVLEIYGTLAKLLPPPSQYVNQIQDSLRNILKLAVGLSIEMRTQRAEYIMLPPLQPDYDLNGDLVRKVHFNASLMNERSGETSSNEELEQRGAVVRLVLFPLVVKRGDDNGEGEDEIVVCPAQVLVARPKGDKKVVRVASRAMTLGGSTSVLGSMRDGSRSVMSVDMRDADENVI